MPFVSTRDNVGLFYRDWGAGEPVIFCAAWALSSVAWQYQMMAVLDSGRRAVACDRRGHGRSDDPGGGFDYDTLARSPHRMGSARGLVSELMICEGFIAIDWRTELPVDEGLAPNCIGGLQCGSSPSIATEVECMNWSGPASDRVR